MKNATLLRVGQESVAARWFGLLAIAVLLPVAVSLKAQTPTETETTVTTLGGGPQYYNPSHSFGSSNSVYGTLDSQFHTPSGLAYDIFQDYLYVADRDNNAIRLIDIKSVNPPLEIFTFAPYPPYSPTNSISQPVGVAVDASGNVFVLNRGKGTNGTVVEFDYLGNLIATNMTRLTNASGIALDTIGNIYVTTSNTVFKITPAGVSNVVVTITNAGTFLQGIVVKRSGPSAGWLAVCDSGRNGIYLINPASGAVTTNAGFNGAGDGTGNRNQGVFNASARFFQPSGLAEAGDGSLIVTDFGNQRVKVVTVTGLTTNLYGVASNDWWGGPGATTPTGGAALPGWSDGAVWEPDGGPGFGNVQARMPFGVAIGPDGTVYTTEDYYHIIREVTGANIKPPLPWPPTPPTGPTATAGYGQVFLTWTASAGATSYNIKRSTSSGAETNLLTSTTGTSYTDTNLLDGTTYYYVVSALNTGGEGPNSDEVSATPLFSPAPTISSVTTNYGLVSLTWSVSAGATSYNVKRSPSHLGPYTTIASTASTSYDDTSVVNGTTYYYVVSAVNAGGENPTNSAEVSATPPLPPVPDPQIGWVTFPPPFFTSVFNVGSPAGLTFNNDVPIVIIGAAGSKTFYTYLNTPTVTNVPDPTSASVSAPVGYVDGLPFSTVTSLTVAQILPNVAIKAIGEQSGHPNSAIVSALFQFVVGNPQVIGDNAAQFTVSDITAGAQMFYTTDGSAPNPTNASAVGPITNGATLSLSIPNGTNLTFEICGFKANYQPSSIVTNVFSITNFVANSISFGFAPNDPVAKGEASSVFVGSAGQTFYAPVTMSVLSGTKMYSLQFNVTVANTNATSLAQVASGTIGFRSMLVQPLPPPTNFPPGVFLYATIPPYMFIANETGPVPPGSITNYNGTNFINLEFVTNNLLGVGWLERYTQTNLYNTLSQDLIQFSMAHDDIFQQGNGDVIAGGYAFQVPANAGPNDAYQIQIGRPSATSDGIGTPGSSVFIATPTNGSLGGGAINSIKVVTLGQLKYIAGNSYPFRWFNAGDFGNTNLQNGDVEQVFQSAIYQFNYPPAGSDFFDSMDSCGTNLAYLDGDTGFYTNSPTAADLNALFNGTDSTINNMAYGDGQLDVCDVYVTFRRSVDTNDLVWFERFWTNGFRVAVASNAPAIQSAVKQPSGKSLPAVSTNNPPPVSITNTPSVNFASTDLVATAGQQISIPVTASVFGIYPLRVLMLNISVVPLDGSPALTTPIQFSPIMTLDPAKNGQPDISDSVGNGNYAGAWLTNGPGLTGNATLGTLTITIPANATSSSAYAVHFDHASGSPNGIASFPKHTLTGLITLSSRTNSYYHDGIPDSWRLRWFGTINNLLSVSNACPSGDGVNNWRKYVAGVDPNTPNDFPSLNPNTPPPSGAAMSIYWPTVSGKQYAILSSSSLFPGNWITNATITGTGTDMEFDDNSTGAVKFYRVLILP